MFTLKKLTNCDTGTPGTLSMSPRTAVAVPRQGDLSALPDETQRRLEELRDLLKEEVQTATWYCEFAQLGKHRFYTLVYMYTV